MSGTDQYDRGRGHVGDHDWGRGDCHVRRRAGKRVKERWWMMNQLHRWRSDGTLRIESFDERSTRHGVLSILYWNSKATLGKGRNGEISAGLGTKTTEERWPGDDEAPSPLGKNET